MYGYFCERDYEKDFPYTDLALERRRADTSLEGVDYKKEVSAQGIWERIKITSKEGARSIGRPMGIYDTLQLSRMDVMDLDAVDDAIEEVARELCYICDQSNISPMRILIAGLGNRALTPDSIGVKSAENVKATLHIKDFDKNLFDSLECSEIAVCTPGVAASSGLDAAVTIKGLCDAIKPDAVIAIDALASRAVSRLGTTVQISNTGIMPGSGLGNARRPINEENVGVPVIAIGVPTVIDSRMFWFDATEGEERVYSEHLSGPSMFVSPKEINEIVDTAAKIIGGGINQAFGILS